VATVSVHHGQGRSQRETQWFLHEEVLKDDGVHLTTTRSWRLVFLDGVRAKWACRCCFGTETGVIAKWAFFIGVIANARQNATGVCALKLVL
jgi:hypothetical protein